MTRTMLTAAAFLSALPASRGHFRLESGYHTDLWLTLDGLFVDPAAVAPMVGALADLVRPHAVTAVCGPLLGGAFLAQALATSLGVEFYYTEAQDYAGDRDLFNVRYQLTSELQRRIRGRRVAVVDDVMSAGSSVRATVAALTDAGATPVVVAALMVLGDTGSAHFTERGVPVETLLHRNFTLWKPADCPLCQSGIPLEKR